MRYDAVIIGAGMSGLAAAIRLAQLDRRVVVLERHEVWGGLNSFYTLGGRPFDVGLHALTNWVPPRTRGAPLSILLKQLRIRHEELRLGEQGFSEIRMPGLRLEFTNELGHLEAEIERAFPGRIDGFRALVEAVRAYDLARAADGGAPAGREPFASGRAALESFIDEPLLREALLMPLTFYGSAREDDVDWYQLVVLFRAIFFEGLARPEGGIRTLLNLLVKRCKRAGAELRTRAGVRRIALERGAVTGVELEDGTEIETTQILSSAGWVETMRLCGADVERDRVRADDTGRLSFVESVSILDRLPAEIGLGAATCFYCTEERFAYRRPDGLIDPRSGVLSIPNNFAATRPLREGVVRLTVLGSHPRWNALAPPDYAAAKERAADDALRSAAAFFPDWSPHTVFRDVFTPATVERFTGHAGGAIYGSPRKRLDGATGFEGLGLCGTDQGFLGIVGALLSGIAMANRHAFSPAKL